MQVNSLNPAIFDKPINSIYDDKNDARLKEQTDAFEELILKFMLDSALKLDNPLLPKAAGSEIYNAMYRESIADAVSGNFGYSELLFSYLKDLQVQNPQNLSQNPQNSAFESQNLSQNLTQKNSQNPYKDA